MKKKKDVVWTNQLMLYNSRQEGFHAFYKGITPRVLRVAPGQAIVFAVYERVRKVIETMQSTDDDLYTE